MRSLFSTSLVAMAALAVTAATAVAGPVTPSTPTYCAGSSVLSLSDVTFRGSNADNCYGVASGNDDYADVNALNSFGAADWDARVKDDGAPGSMTYKGITWTLSAPNTANNGTWTLSLADPLPVNLPVAVDMLVILKGGTSWAAYFFDNEAFYTTGANGGAFNIKFKNGGGQVPNLSHMSVYFRDGGTPPPPPGDTVPEPTAMALLGLGLLGAGVVGRRK